MYSDIKHAFGLVMRDARLNAGLSQEAMGKAAGLHRTYIADIERGERNVSLENIARLANALDLPIHEIFRRVEIECKK